MRSRLGKTAGGFGVIVGHGGETGGDDAVDRVGVIADMRFTPAFLGGERSPSTTISLSDERLPVE
jgi:hypothetical protein